MCGMSCPRLDSRRPRRVRAAASARLCRRCNARIASYRISSLVYVTRQVQVIKEDEYARRRGALGAIRLDWNGRRGAHSARGAARRRRAVGVIARGALRPPSACRRGRCSCAARRRSAAGECRARPTAPPLTCSQSEERLLCNANQPALNDRVVDRH